MSKRDDVHVIPVVAFKAGNSDIISNVGWGASLRSKHHQERILPCWLSTLGAVSTEVSLELDCEHKKGHK